MRVIKRGLFTRAHNGKKVWKSGGEGKGWRGVEVWFVLQKWDMDIGVLEKSR